MGRRVGWRVAAGACDGPFLVFLGALYGVFVLLNPRFEPATLLLWLLAPLALAGGGLALWGYHRRRSRSAASEDPALFELTAEEEARLQRLIGTEPSPNNPA